MQFPPFLQAGDTIGITCPSGFLPFSKTVFAKQTLMEWGFKIFTGATVGREYFYFSDTDERRLADLQAQLDDPEIKAIMMGRGGYGMSRIIDDLDFTKFRKNPKWIIGFSDITVLHSHIQSNFGIATLHGPMCGAFKGIQPEPTHLIALKKALTGEAIEYPVPLSAYNRSGMASGILIGGNLAILAHLTGSVSQLNTEGKILFIEDIGEYLYNVDRMLLNLKRAGMLDNLAGLVCGGFTDLLDTERPFGKDIQALIMDIVKEYDYPVCFDFPAGHLAINYTLCLGKAYELTVAEQNVQLRESACPKEQRL